VTAHPYIGIVPRPEECNIPADWTVVLLRYCQCCGFLFVSRGDKYCRRCHANAEPLGKDVTIEILQDLMDSESPVLQ